MSNEQEKTKLWKVYGILMGVMVGGAVLILGGQAAWNAIQQNMLSKAIVENKPASSNSLPLSSPPPPAVRSQTPSSTPSVSSVSSAPSTLVSPSKNSLRSNQEIGTEEEIDKITDQIFYERYPELAGRKIRSDESSLQEEWSRIKQCEAVVDYIFYQRHPELGRRKIVQSEYSLAQEWSIIKDSVTGCR
jgi:cytoskeletal protein RodZ